MWGVNRRAVTESNRDDSLEFTRRLTPVLVLFVLFFIIAAVRILYLQIGLGEQLRKQSQINRIRHDVLPAQRGPILDRNGKVLAADEPVFNLIHVEGHEAVSDTELHKLSKGFDLDYKRLRERVKSKGNRTIINGLNDSQRIWFEEQSDNFSAFQVQVRPRRVYRFGAVTSSVLGYTGEINPNELDKRRREGLHQGKYVGKTGIEKYYDQKLQGTDGVRWVETTATGERIRVLDSPKPIKPREGDSITLNLYIFLQNAVAASFPSGSAGAVVVMEVPSGKIRALHSEPAYDPNNLVSGVSRSVDELLRAENDPLHNRVIQSRFPPGSTFKIIPYLAAQGSNSYDINRTYECDGEFDFGDQTFGCWKEEGHGELALNRGLIHSCNVYFYNLARELGFEPIQRLAENMDFGKRTRIDMPDEAIPQLSTPSLKKDLTGRPWVWGDALNAVIGQGFTLISPIKQAQLLGSLITGKNIRPGLRKGAEANRSNDFPPVAPERRQHLIETLDDVTDDGTGYWGQHTENYQRIAVDIVGKTGTIQKIKRDDQEDTPPSDAWFVSSAPKNDPQYVVVVFRIEAGTGGDVAAPHAREIYQEMIALGYFRENRGEILTK